MQRPWDSAQPSFPEGKHPGQAWLGSLLVKALAEGAKA